MRSFSISYLEDIKEQRKIADVLSAYDDLIENNRKQIKLLEEAVRYYPGLETVILSDDVQAQLPAHVNVVRVPEDVMAYISPMETPQGALFLCRLPEKKD